MASGLSGLLCAWLVVVGAGVATAPPSGADSPVVGCGTVITANTTLGNDLTDCHGIGLIVGADHLVLNLNGHTVDGDGTADAEGIQMIGRHDVTVANGTITDFVEGVAVLNGRRVRVQDVTLTDHRHVGVFIDRSSVVSVQRARLSRIAFSGIFGTRSTRLRIEENRVTSSGGAVGLRHTTSSRVAHNHSSRTGCGALLLYEGSRNNLIDSNVVIRDGCEGVVLHAGSDRNVIRRNHIRFSDAGVGIDQSQDNLIADNTLYGNRFVGVYAFGASGNKIARNRVVRNGEGSEGGIHVLDDDSSTPSQGNTLIANKVIASVGDGIWVEAGSQATFLVGNTVVGSSKDGIKVDEPRVTLTRNLAAHNQDLGIRAVPGVIDGGGNTARANGDTAQCLHVECT